MKPDLNYRLYSDKELMNLKEFALKILENVNLQLTLRGRLYAEKLDEGEHYNVYLSQEIED